MVFAEFELWLTKIMQEYEEINPNSGTQKAVMDTGYIIYQFKGDGGEQDINWPERLACAVTEPSVHY